MAEKRKVRRKKAEGSKQLAVGSEQRVTATPTPYEIGTWSGLPLYKCLLCKFDTLSEDKIFAHLEEHRLNRLHAPASTASEKTPPSAQHDQGEIFEVELKEIDSTMDENGNVHKTYTVKE